MELFLGISGKSADTPKKLLITAHAAYLVNHWDSSLIRHANFHQADDTEEKVLCKATLEAKTKLL